MSVYVCIISIYNLNTHVYLERESLFYTTVKRQQSNEPNTLPGVLYLHFTHSDLWRLDVSGFYLFPTPSTRQLDREQQNSLPLHFVQMFMFPRGWVLLTPWLKVFTYRVEYLSSPSQSCSPPLLPFLHVSSSILHLVLSPFLPIVLLNCPPSTSYFLHLMYPLYSSLPLFCIHPLLSFFISPPPFHIPVTFIPFFFHSLCHQCPLLIDGSFTSHWRGWADVQFSVQPVFQWRFF